MSAASTYLSVTEFKKRIDWRTVAQLVSDTDTALTEAELASDGNLAAALDGASGEVEAAILSGGKYTLAEIAAWDGVALAHFLDLIAKATMRRLYQRRPDQAVPREYTEDLLWAMQALSYGERVFG